jgi:hypothetical protein
MSPPAKRPAWQVHLNKRARGLAGDTAGEGAATLCNLGEGRSSPAKVEGVVVNSIQTSFVSERMISRHQLLSIEAPELSGRAFDLLKKRPIPFYPQLR